MEIGKARRHQLLQKVLFFRQVRRLQTKSHPQRLLRVEMPNRPGPALPQLPGWFAGRGPSLIRLRECGVSRRQREYYKQGSLHLDSPVSRQEPVSYM